TKSARIRHRTKKQWNHPHGRRLLVPK
ncbi:unnamed protein product, partial [Oikopleura dioica]